MTGKYPIHTGMSDVFLIWLFICAKSLHITVAKLETGLGVMVKCLKLHAQDN